MVPLSRQTDFFVPEMKEEVRTDVKEEDSDDDRGTDITGKDFTHPRILSAPPEAISDSIKKISQTRRKSCQFVWFKVYGSQKLRDNFQSGTTLVLIFCVIYLFIFFKI